MAIVIDPEGYEIDALRKAVDFTRHDVLEIGCGDGRLTFRYAPLARHIYAIDPDEASIAAARQNTPTGLRSRIEFHVGTVENLNLPKEKFDIALLSWAL
jgi:ubiquinone/menaquinone biosynthesis C-methylase UbiE